MILKRNPICPFCGAKNNLASLDSRAHNEIRSIVTDWPATKKQIATLLDVVTGLLGEAGLQKCAAALQLKTNHIFD